MNFNRLERFMDSLIPFGIPGADILVHQDGRTLYRHQSGFRDREAGLQMRGNERYFMYSCSKVVTVTAALQLYEQGAFLLDDPLARYIPEYEHITVKTADGIRPAEKPLTIRHLFTMTAGLNYDLASPAIERVRKATCGRLPTVAVARALASEPLDFEPGTHWQYSLCHDVLAALVEVISGERFANYVQNHIFAPLGMTQSGFHISPDETFAAQYRMDEATRALERIPLTASYVLGPDYDSGGAGIVSTVEDYAKFLDALACGGIGATGARILSARTISLMQLNQLDARQMVDFNWEQFVGYGYGLGVRTLIDRAKGGALSPVGEFGWGGAAGAYLLIDPVNRLTVVYGQHMLNNQEPYVHPRLRNLVYACLDD